MTDRSKLKKALIFDCDNTLWSGVLGEDKIVPNEEIQNNAVLFAEHGVIIGICSKQNYVDVMDALRKQILTGKYISVSRVNWKDKVSNLKEIAQELNIGLDAIVFVDDSEFERGLVNQMLPEILTIHPAELMATVVKWFDLSGDISKTEQYKANYKRMKAQEQFVNIDDYLKSLDMVLVIRLNEKEHTARIAEMTQKTNQFNLTTVRLKEEDVLRMMEFRKVYSLSVRDRFGDHGITGACFVADDSIELFLLSCRVLGKGIEFAFLDYVMKDLLEAGIERVSAKFCRTDKNEQTRFFYKNAGFETFAYDRFKSIYYIDTIRYKPCAKPHFRYE